MSVRRTYAWTMLLALANQEVPWENVHEVQVDETRGAPGNGGRILWLVIGGEKRVSWIACTKAI
jgi:hypothetical protein